MECSIEGKKLYTCYQQNGCLTFAMRNKLVRLVIDSEIHKSPDEKLSINTIHRLALGIVELFPHEFVYTYFIPYKKEKEHVRPNRGKLWDRYCNIRKDIRKLQNPNDKNSYKRNLNIMDNLILNDEGKAVMNKI